MKKIHGVFSIQPLTIKDVSIADDAAIQEHKLLLEHHTEELHGDIVQLRADFEAHKADNFDPHGGILYQSTIRPTYIECPPTSGNGLIILRNTGTGTFTTITQGATTTTGLTTTGSLKVNGPTTMDGNLIVNGELTIPPGNLIDGVDVGAHNHSGAAGMGVRIPASSVYIGSTLNSSSVQADHIDVHARIVQDTVGGMVSGNTENGIAVTYSGAGTGAGKLNFDVNDFIITLAGDASGSVGITNLSSATLTVTVLDDSHNHTNLTGTTNQTFHVDSDGAGPKLKNSSGELQVRNAADNAFANFRCANLYVEGTTTTIVSETVTINDNILTLNNNVSGTPTENAGIEIRRGTSTNSTVLWNESTDRWECGIAGATSNIVRESDLATPNVAVTKAIQDIVGGMVSSNIENGISVTYDNTNGKLNFDVNDSTLTLVRAGSSTFSYPRVISISAMPNTNYTVSITPTGDHGGNVGEITVRNKTTTSFQVYRTGTSTGSFDWLVIGY